MKGPLIEMSVDLLVVDDDPEIRRLLSLMLKREGVSHVVATHAEEAKMLCGQHNPRLVISDVDMPGTSGVDLAPQLRKICSGIEIWAFTGSSGDPYLLSSSVSVFDRIFPKTDHEYLLSEALAYLGKPVPVTA